MEVWGQNFYYNLGRFVKCPRCGMHSDLSIDQAAAPADDVSLSKYTLEGKAVTRCTLFHEEPWIAWVWFKHHAKDALPDPPVENNYPTDEPVPPGYTPANSDYDFMAGV